MKALTVAAGGRLSVEEIPVPSYGPCQALVRMRSCGVCNGTDTKLIHGTFKNFSSYPAVLGHEGVGEVVAVGDRVRSFRIGDRVLLPFLEEKVGEYTPGWGAYSEYAVVGDAAAYIAEGMGPGTPQWSEGYLAQTVLSPKAAADPVGASMIVTFREVLSAVRRFGFEANRQVLIFGAGPVGLCFTKFCRLLGLKRVVTVDVTDEKAAAAKAMGADVVFNSAACDLDGELKRLVPEGFDYVVDAVGVNALLNQAMGLIADHGKICGYGISPKLGMDLDWSRAPYNWTLQFVQWPSKREEGEAHSQIMAWIDQGVLEPRDFISDVFPFSRVLDAFRHLEKRLPDTKKIVIDFQEG